MAADGVDPTAIEVFSPLLPARGERRDRHDPRGRHRAARHGRPRRRRGRPTRTPSPRCGRRSSIKLNGGLGTSMGLDRGQDAARGPRRADLPRRHRRSGAGPARAARRTPAAAVHEQLPHPRRHARGAGDVRRTCRDADLPLDFLQNKEPKLLRRRPDPGQLAGRPGARVVPAGPRRPLHRAARHRAPRRDARRRLHPGVRVQLRQPRRRARPAGRRLVRRERAPFAIEAVRRTPSDRKGGHFARRKSDGRIVLRETAQTARRGQGGAGGPRAGTASPPRNNLWFDLAAMQRRARRARRHPRPGDDPQHQDRRPGRRASSPEVDPDRDGDGRRDRGLRGRHHRSRSGATGSCRSRRPTTCWCCAATATSWTTTRVLHQVAEEIPFVDLGKPYKLVGRFEERFPDGVPEPARRRRASWSPGDWSFGADVTVVGEVERRGHRTRSDAIARRHAPGLTRERGPRRSRVAAMAFVPSSDQPSVSVEEHVERILSRCRAAAAVRPAAAGGRSACRSREEVIVARWTCRPSTTPRWTATRSSTPTWPEPPSEQPVHAARRRRVGRRAGHALRDVAGHGGQDHDRRAGAARRRRRRAGRVDRRRCRDRAHHPGPAGGPARAPRGEDVAHGRPAARRRAPCSGRASWACWPASARPRCGPGRVRAWSIMSTGAELREPGAKLVARRDLRLELLHARRGGPPAPARSPTGWASSPTTRPSSPTRCPTSWCAPTSWSPAAASAWGSTTSSRRCCRARHRLVRRGADAAGQAAGLRPGRRGRHADLRAARQPCLGVRLLPDVRAPGAAPDDGRHAVPAAADASPGSATRSARSPARSSSCVRVHGYDGRRRRT